MGAAEIRDAVAVKVKNLAAASRAHVYANGSTDATIAPWPQELVDNAVHVLVRRGATDRTGGTGNQFVARSVDVEWWLPAIDLAEAERQMDQIEADMLTAFSSGITLGGLVNDSWYAGSDPPRYDVVDRSERPWVVWVTHVQAIERLEIEMTP